MTVRILVGDVRARLRELPADSANCVCTSPPYWGLRCYGVDGQLGLEPTPQEHVAQMVDVFREVRRVLRPDGVCWVNYGDSYATAVNGRSAADTKATGNDDRTFRDKPFSTVAGGLKPKDLCMVPFRFAIAMQEDGWWLRSVLPWVKRNPMPESIEDRPATAIEQVFMFAKSERYWFDAQAVRQKRNSVENANGFRGGSYTDNEPGPRKKRGNYRVPAGWSQDEGAHSTIAHNTAPAREGKQRGHGRRHQSFNERWDAMERKQQTADGRSFRNTDLFYESLRAGSHGLISGPDGAPLALDVAPMPFSEAHFATFPPRLIAPLIASGCPEGGLVLDPFGGAGTTGLVAARLRRSAVLIELNPEYAEIARRRIDGDAPMFDPRTILEAAQ
jgi:DNA modification methylase